MEPAGGLRGQDDGLFDGLLILTVAWVGHVGGHEEQRAGGVVERAIHGGGGHVPQAEAVADEAEAGAGAQGGAGENDGALFVDQLAFDHVADEEGRGDDGGAAGLFVQLRPGHQFLWVAVAAAVDDRLHPRFQLAQVMGEAR